MRSAAPRSTTALRRPHGVDQPDRMLFALDGTVVWDLKQADYEAAGGDWTPFSGAWPHYLILNVAVNTGMTPNATDAAPFPAAMVVDWLRVETL